MHKEVSKVSNQTWWRHAAAEDCSPEVEDQVKNMTSSEVCALQYAHLTNSLWQTQKWWTGQAMPLNTEQAQLKFEDKPEEKWAICGFFDS